MVARADPTTEPPAGATPLPVVVIVGRPNVGKSTLFNAITGTRRSIVGDEPGIILKQARVALDSASQIIFLIDGRTEITGADRDLAKMLRRLGKPVVLAVNKIDTTARESLTHEFHALGFSDLFPISAEHRIGFDDLLEHVTRDFPAGEAAEAPEGAAQPIKVAIIGRPNVGKSTLLNALAGSERAIVSPIPGTTRDAVDERVVRHGVEFVFVDTAGIRRKGKTKLMAEKLSVVMARRHIRMANVVILMVDATEGPLGLDATIAGYAHEDGRAIVVCVNKWDLHGEKGKRSFTEALRDELKFLDYAPVAFISAKTGVGVKGLFKLIQHGYESASKRVTTGELNRFVETLEPSRDTKIFYMTQASVRPPGFIVFTGEGRDLHFSTERYLVNQLRKRFGFEGTPIVIKARRR
jgi:GTP-binding protein